MKISTGWDDDDDEEEEEDDEDEEGRVEKSIVVCAEDGVRALGSDDTDEDRARVVVGVEEEEEEEDEFEPGAAERAAGCLSFLLAPVLQECLASDIC